MILPVLKRVACVVVVCLGIALLLFALAALYQASLAFTMVINHGTTGISFVWRGNRAVVEAVNSDSKAFAAGVRPGDVLLEVDGEPADNAVEVMRRLEGNTAGTMVWLTFQQKSDKLTLRMELTLASLFSRLITLMLLFALPCIMFVYVAVGLWGLVKQRFTPVVFLVAMVCFLLGALMYTPFYVGYAQVPSFVSQHLYFYQVKDLLNRFILLAPCFWLCLFLQYPQPVRFFQRHKLTVCVVVFSLPVAFILLQLGGAFSQTATMLTIIAIFSTYMPLGIIIQALEKKRITSPMRMRQHRLIMFGVEYGAMAIGIGFAFVVVALMLFPGLFARFAFFVVLVFLVSQMGSLLIPLSFLNSFFKHKLLATETAFRRRARYIAFTLLLFAIYFVLAYSIGRVLVNYFTIQDPQIIIFVSLLIAVTFAPINKRLQSWLERRHFPEKTRIRESLPGLFEELSHAESSKRLYEILSNWMHRVGYGPIILQVQGTILPAEADSDCCKALLGLDLHCGAAIVWDEMEQPLPAPLSGYLTAHKVVATAPLCGNGGIQGLLHMGPKQSGEDLTGVDVEIFTDIARHTSKALDVISLHREYAEKQRLQQEVDLAREIQNHLLPARDVRVPDMELHWAYHPCHEMAGDYLDVLNMSDRYLLLVADVSGKGAGAALMMANLQAAIRMTVPNYSLDAAVSRVNELIYRNAAARQFITLCLGIWYPGSRAFFYINAGHNPPLVIKQAGDVLALEPTGPGLGIFPRPAYQVRQITLEAQDLLVLYSDGYEDVFNQRKEIFGVRRLRDTLVRLRDRSPKDIISGLDQEVARFSSQPPVDDRTIAVARVIGN